MVPGTEENIKTIRNINFTTLGDSATMPYSCSMFLVWYLLDIMSTIIKLIVEIQQCAVNINNTISINESTSNETYKTKTCISATV